MKSSVDENQQFTGLPMPGDSISKNILDKNEYRDFLLQQIAVQRENKRKEKESRMNVAITGAVDPEKSPNRLGILGNPIYYSNPRQTRSPKYQETNIKKPTEHEYINHPKLNELDSLQVDTFDPPNYQLTNQGNDIVNSLSSILHRPHRIPGFDNSSESFSRPGFVPVVRLERIPKQQNYNVNSAETRKSNNNQTQREYVSTSPMGDCKSSSEVSKKKYNAELLNQINDNNARKRKQMEAEIRENVMIQLEFENKSPWGREGGGAPRKKAVPDQFEPYMKESNLEIIPLQEVEQFSQKKAPVQTNVHGEVTFARGGNSIFGTPKTDLEKQTTARYRKELEKQILNQNAAKQVEMERRKAEDEKEMREIKEYHDQMKKREEDEHRIRMEKERARMEGIQEELEMRRHVLEDRKKYVYKNEEIPTFCPREPTTFHPTKHVEHDNDKYITIEQNKQSKLLQRLEQFRTQLNSKKTQVENFIDKQKKIEMKTLSLDTSDVQKVSKLAKNQKKTFEDIMLRPMSFTSDKENEILSDFWKISEFEGEFENTELDTFPVSILPRDDSEAFITDVYTDNLDSPKQDEPVKPNKRLVKQMKNLRQKIMGLNDVEYYDDIFDESSNKLNRKFKLDSMTDIGDDGYSWLNPRTQ